MRIPWVATLDALLGELERHVEIPEDGAEPLGAKRPEERRPTTREDHLREAIRLLLKVRPHLFEAAWASPRKHPRHDLDHGESLESLDKRELKYPLLEGREGLARFVDAGGLFGPLFGARIAAVVREEFKFRRGAQSTYDQAWMRRFAVKRIATIMYLWGVSRPKAVEMFCEDAFPEVEGHRYDTVFDWVKKDQEQAKRLLSFGGGFEIQMLP